MKPSRPFKILIYAIIATACMPVGLSHDPAYSIAEARETKPEAVILHVLEEFTASVSAYSSSPDETDDTPNVTANGETTGPGTIACPARYKFGTRVDINGTTYHCNDRMAKRYRTGNYFDIWLPSKAAAIQFGRQKVSVKIIAN